MVRGGSEWMDIKNLEKESSCFGVERQENFPGRWSVMGVAS